MKRAIPALCLLGLVYSAAPAAAQICLAAPIFGRGLAASARIGMGDGWIGAGGRLTAATRGSARLGLDGDAYRVEGGIYAYEAALSVASESARGTCIWVAGSAFDAVSGPAGARVSGQAIGGGLGWGRWAHVGTLDILPALGAAFTILERDASDGGVRVHAGLMLGRRRTHAGALLRITWPYESSPLRHEGTHQRFVLLASYDLSR